MRSWPAIHVYRLTEPDRLQGALASYSIRAVEEHPGNWRVFFATHDERDRAVGELARAFPDCGFESLDVPDEDWAARSQAGLRAIRIGRIVVAPPWDVPDRGTLDAGDDAPSDPVLVVVQPSMGFGTGHHPTTRLCLAALQQFDLEGRTVLDIGTGSGVLAIAASLLGAAGVIAIDDDADALECARENAERNEAAVDLLEVDFRTAALSPADLVMANLTGGLVVATAARLQDLTTRRGVVILSGFERHEEPAVLAAFPRMRVVDRGMEDEWVCLTLQHEGAFE